MSSAHTPLLTPRPQAIHWNSPLKTRVDSPRAPYFRAIQHAYDSLPGAGLRRGVLGCAGADPLQPSLDPQPPSIDPQPPSVDPKPLPSDPCHEFKAARNASYRTHLFFLPPQLTGL